MNFAVNSKNPYFAELKFYEESQFLKQVNLSFDPPVQQGTSIRLSLACDISSRFTARAEAAGVVVDVVFEQSPAPELPTKGQLNQMIDSVMARIAEIPAAGDRIVAETRAKKLTREIEYAFDEGDACKMAEKLTELNNIMIILPPPPPSELIPKRQKFDEIVSRVRNKNETSTLGTQRYREEITIAAAKGYRAYDNLDQQKLNSAIGELREIEDLLDPPPPPPPPPAAATEQALGILQEQGVGRARLY